MSGPGKKLQKWRKKSGLSQEAAAARLGHPVAQGTWAAWEGESKPPDLQNALNIEALTGGHVRAVEWVTVKARRKKARAAAESGPSVEEPHKEAG